MKFVLAAILAFVAAESPDCPESTQVFSYNERSAPAAGFVQLSACQKSGVMGVMCDNELVQFATGMNGDEDLGEDITMKGNKFHFNQENQQKLVQFATGMNGDEDLGEDITMKGNKFHFNQELIQTQAEPEATAHKADWEGYTQPDKVHTLDPKVAKTHTAWY